MSRLFSPFRVRFAGPIDTRFSVNNSSELRFLSSSGLAYPYMKVVNLEDGMTYELQDDMETWTLFTAKGEKGDPGPPGPIGPAITVGNVQLTSGDPNLQISINPATGELDFNLTLPPYILGEETQDLHTNDKTLIGAINEIYDQLNS